MRSEVDIPTAQPARARRLPLDWLASSPCLLVVMVAWAGCLAAGVVGGRDKLVVISVFAFLAMLAGWLGAERVPGSHRLAIWADGAAAGAMLTSAALFLLPMAIVPNPAMGSAGVAIGFVLGIALDRLIGGDHGGSQSRDASVLAISLHALAAGIVMGLIYARMPALGVMLGVAIVSHKLPAGYALARNRLRHGLARAPVLWPAALVGLAAIPVALCLSPSTPAQNAVLFGLATGVFMHVGQDFARARGLAIGGHPDRAFVLALIAGTLLIALLHYLVAGGA